MKQNNLLLQPFWGLLMEHLAEKGARTLSQLSHTLGVKEDELSLHIDKLIGYGIPIEKTNGFYELLAPCSLLSSDKMAALKDDKIKTIYVFEKLSSTNTFLRESAETSGAICLAECQWGGRGRFGRHWESPFGSHLSFSILYPFELNQDLSCLGLVVSLSVVRVLEAFFSQEGCFKVKWPNDVFLDGLKVGGILVEFQKGSLPHQGAVIGVGLNINRSYRSSGSKDNSAAFFLTCEDHFQIYTDRNALCCKMVKTMLKDFQVLQDKGFKPFLDQWAEYDYLLDQEVVVQGALPTTTGLCKGIDAQGKLVMELASGQRVSFGAGEVSLGSRSFYKNKEATANC